MRWMVSVPGALEEAWVDYIQHATRRSEELASSHGATDWVALARARRCEFAGKAAASRDGRWTRRLLSWQLSFSALPQRCVGRPLRRWEDDLVRLAGADWPEAAHDSAVWNVLAEAYVSDPT